MTDRYESTWNLNGELVQSLHTPAPVEPYVPAPVQTFTHLTTDEIKKVTKTNPAAKIVIALLKKHARLLTAEDAPSYGTAVTSVDVTFADLLHLDALSESCQISKEVDHWQEQFDDWGREEFMAALEAKGRFVLKFQTIYAMPETLGKMTHDVLNHLRIGFITNSNNGGALISTSPAIKKYLSITALRPTLINIGWICSSCFSASGPVGYWEDGTWYPDGKTCDYGACPHHLCYDCTDLSQHWCEECDGANCPDHAEMHHADTGHESTYWAYHDDDSCGECGGDGCGECTDSDGGGSGAGLGHMIEPPWVTRGIKVPDTVAPAHQDGDVYNTWGFDPRSINPVQAAADFYLLEAMAAGVVIQVHREAMGDPMIRMINHMLNELVGQLDLPLAGYTDMVIGGELRHHRAVKLPYAGDGRTGAWLAWKTVRDTLGLSALLDASVLFRDFNSSGYGNENWAACSDALYARLSGQISPRLWLDRVFNLQHNGGALLNKVKWKDDVNVQRIVSDIGPAHASNPPDWDILLSNASGDVHDMFRRYTKWANNWRRVMREPIRPLPRRNRLWWVPQAVRQLVEIHPPSAQYWKKCQRHLRSETYGQTVRVLLVTPVSATCPGFIVFCGYAPNEMYPLAHGGSAWVSEEFPKGVPEYWVSSVEQYHIENDGWLCASSLIDKDWFTAELSGPKDKWQETVAGYEFEPPGVLAEWTPMLPPPEPEPPYLFHDGPKDIVGPLMVSTSGWAGYTSSAPITEDQIKAHLQTIYQKMSHESLIEVSSGDTPTMSFKDNPF